MTSKALMNTYGQRALTLVKGEGAYVWDDQGKKYLDALAGIAVCGLGHAHLGVAAAVAAQAATLVHCSNLYNIPAQEALADKLSTLSGMSNMFFSNSGAEANEAAIKIARLHGHAKGIELPTIIVTDQAFHGRTLATLTATGNRKVHAGFEPLVRGFSRAPFNDIDALQVIGENNPNIVAVLVEPIQGEGGVNLPAPDYLQQLRALCDAKGWLLMLDEIQTANGRTGSYFHYQQHNILPDVVTIAKGLGNGVPIGACLTHGPAAQLMQPGNHGSTFGGNPIACAAALATINAIESDNLAQRASELGTQLLQAFKTALADCDKVKDIRGSGLMIGIELSEPCAELVARAADQGLLINVTAANVVRLLPPLIFTDQQAEQLVAILVPLIKAF
ncbi:MAG: aspartate aminotransferase family protein [Gammaproteobacteria bacterium]|nr:aspartate aminotransferase family protein [Gammaproteobacteria bacterium]MBQ0838162.1 aspartate aminotransferase family protein [Gammaproteobacteria bacterium]